MAKMSLSKISKSLLKIIDNIENIKAFTSDIENVKHELNRKNSEILIAGDYNINL